MSEEKIINRATLTERDQQQNRIDDEMYNQINRESDLVRCSTLYLQLNNFIEYYGILAFLRSLSQLFVDRFGKDKKYGTLATSLMILYSFFSHWTLNDPESK